MNQHLLKTTSLYKINKKVIVYLLNYMTKIIKYYLGFNTKKFFNVFKEGNKKMEEINETNEVYMEECEFPTLKENGDIGEPMPRQGKLCGFGCFSGKVCGIGCM